VSVPVSFELVLLTERSSLVPNHWLVDVLKRVSRVSASPVALRFNVTAVEAVRLKRKTAFA